MWNMKWMSLHHRSSFSMSILKTILGLERTAPMMLSVFLSLNFAVRAVEIHQWEGCVVMLKCSHRVTEKVDGVEYEVWLKNPRTGDSFCRTNVVAGTGFIVQGKRIPFIVTAAHIAGQMDSETEITVRGASNLPTTIQLADLIPRTGTGTVVKTLWFRHSVADCAIHPILASPRTADLKYTVSVPVDLLATASNSPAWGDSIKTFGFALGLGTQVTFSPITLESKPASGLLNEGGVNFFLLQNPGINGLSGAPFFQSGEPRVVAFSAKDIGTVSGGERCWGLLSRTDSDYTGGKMARIIHAGHITELIEGFEKMLPSGVTPSVAPTESKPSKDSLEKK